MIMQIKSNCLIPLRKEKKDDEINQYNNLCRKNKPKVLIVDLHPSL